MDLPEGRREVARLQLRTGWMAAGAVALGIATVAPSALAASNTTSAKVTQTSGSAAAGAWIQKIATDLSLTGQEVRQSLGNAGVAGLADAAHMSVSELRQTLRKDGIQAGVRAHMRVRGMVRHGVRVGLSAIAKALGLTPRQMVREARQHKLQLPSGVTAQSLETTANAAVAQWLAGLGAKHPRLTASREARLERVIEQRIAQLVGRFAGA